MPYEAWDLYERTASSQLSLIFHTLKILLRILCSWTWFVSAKLKVIQSVKDQKKNTQMKKIKENLGMILSTKQTCLLCSSIRSVPWKEYKHWRFLTSRCRSAADPITKRRRKNTISAFKLENVHSGLPLMQCTGASQDLQMSWGTYCQVSELCYWGRSRSCVIGGLKPQVEVYALMTAGDDWAVSLSEECVLSPPQTLKKADEWLFGARMTSRGDLLLFTWRAF